MGEPKANIQCLHLQQNSKKKKKEEKFQTLEQLNVGDRVHGIQCIRSPKNVISHYIWDMIAKEGKKKNMKITLLYL